MLLICALMDEKRLSHFLTICSLLGMDALVETHDEEEIKMASKALKVLGGRIEKVDNLILPDSNIERNIIVIRKINKINLKYPRKAGVPAKEPI